ncbi:MAG: sugar phosphate isomerase/epimerase [Treponema sp.]|nr:sugar phosphate isomerase/epimerase [Treponema sp.]
MKPTPLGSLLDCSPSGGCVEKARALRALGCESYEPAFWQTDGGRDLGELAETLAAAMAGPPSSIGVYGNPLADDEAGRETRRTLGTLIEAAPRFGSPLVSCFAGRVPGASVADSLDRWESLFGRLADRASALGVAIAFENCRLGDTWRTGRWNIAINPDAWELMFAALPGAPIGLEWEPSHQVLGLADPIAQLKVWAPRVLHVHAKDAVVEREVLALRGAHGATKFGRECLAGFGDTDWSAVFRVLALAGYGGSVDIEIGAVEPYHGGRELEGVELALGRLRSARSTLGSLAAADPAPAGPPATRPPASPTRP